MQDLKQLIKAAAGKLKDDQSQDRLSPAAAEGVIEDFNRLIAEQSMQDPQLETNDGGQPRTTALEARNLLDVVKRACGPASKDVLQLLQPLLAKLGNNSVQVMHCLCGINQLRLHFLDCLHFLCTKPYIS